MITNKCTHSHSQKAPTFLLSLPLSSSSPHLFYSLFRSLLNACHPALSSPVLRSSRFNPPYAPADNPVPSVRVLGQPRTPCSQKSHVHPSHTVHIVRCSCAALSVQQPAASLSPSSLSRCLGRACSFSVSRCGCLWTKKKHRVGANFNAPAGLLGRWVFWRCRLTRIFMWENKHTVGQSVLVGADTYK